VPELAPTKYAGSATWVVAPSAFPLAAGNGFGTAAFVPGNGAVVDVCVDVDVDVDVTAGVTAGVIGWLLPPLATPQMMVPMRATDAAAATGMSQRRWGSMTCVWSWTMARISVRRSCGVIRSASLCRPSRSRRSRSSVIMTGPPHRIAGRPDLGEHEP